MRVVAGRAFEAVRQDSQQEAMIDRRIAEQFFPNGNPIGVKIPRRGNRISTNYEAKPADSLTVVEVVEQAQLGRRVQAVGRRSTFGPRTGL